MNKDTNLRHLKNGLQIREINPHETDFLYQEIFVDRAYLLHGVSLAGSAPVVVDVGANIGLFSLFCITENPKARILAFEPAPHCAKCFRFNLESHAAVSLIEAALMERRGLHDFTYYPHYSIMSSAVADFAQDSQTLIRAISSRLNMDPQSEAARGMVQSIVDDKLSEPVRFDCETQTLSEAIDEHGLDRVDLLKIDVEKAEGRVLEGVQERHWPLIRQLVVEAHDSGLGEHLKIAAMLRDHGFGVAIESDKALAASGIYNIYAVRR